MRALKMQPEIHSYRPTMQRLNEGGGNLDRVANGLGGYHLRELERTGGAPQHVLRASSLRAARADRPAHEAEEELKRARRRTLKGVSRAVSFGNQSRRSTDARFVYLSRRFTRIIRYIPSSRA